MKSFRRDGETARVNTRQGTVQGFEQDGLKVFKGIPYAQAARFHSRRRLIPGKECWMPAATGTSAR